MCPVSWIDHLQLWSISEWWGGSRVISRQEVVKTVGVGESPKGGRQLSGRKTNNAATKSQALEAENLAVIIGVCWKSGVGGEGRGRNSGNCTLRVPGRKVWSASSNAGEGRVGATKHSLASGNYEVSLDLVGRVPKPRVGGEGERECQLSSGD